MTEYRSRRPKDDWTGDMRRMHTFFYKVGAIVAVVIFVVAAIVWAVAYYLL